LAVGEKRHRLVEARIFHCASFHPGISRETVEEGDIRGYEAAVVKFVALAFVPGAQHIAIAQSRRWRPGHGGKHRMALNHLRCCYKNAWSLKITLELKKFQPTISSNGVL
jgi:hypothetical protein